jgi:hypothetical protein
MKLRISCDGCDVSGDPRVAEKTGIRHGGSERRFERRSGAGEQRGTAVRGLVRVQDLFGFDGAAAAALADAGDFL